MLEHINLLVVPVIRTSVPQVLQRSGLIVYFTVSRSGGARSTSGHRISAYASLSGVTGGFRKVLGSLVLLMRCASHGISEMDEAVSLLLSPPPAWSSSRVERKNKRGEPEPRLERTTSTETARGGGVDMSMCPHDRA